MYNIIDLYLPLLYCLITHVCNHRHW